MEVKNRKYHMKVGESFVVYGSTVLLTVKDTAPAACYFKERGLKKDCALYACSACERKDKTSVKFMEVKQNGSSRD